MLDNTPTQPSKFRTKNLVEIYVDAYRMYSTDTEIKFKTSMLKLSLCDYSDMCVLLSGAIRVPNTGKAANPNNRKK